MGGWVALADRGPVAAASAAPVACPKGMKYMLRAPQATPIPPQAPPATPIPPLAPPATPIPP
eukprot:1517377-Rhodomonas_salina.1